MNKTKFLAVLLLCLSLLLPACGTTPPDPSAPDSNASSTTDAATTEAPAETESPYDEKGFLKDDLPEDLDFNDLTVHVYLGDYNKAYAVDMYSEGYNSERLNDAIYNMIKNVEDRLNVKLDYTIESYAWSNYTEHQSTVTSRILANDDSIDLILDNPNYAYAMLENEYFVDLSETKYVNEDMPWYNQTIINSLPTDYLHFLSGDFSIANVKNSFAMYFNADLYKALGNTEDLYSVVDSGKWTLEKMETLIKDCYSDLNGNDASDPKDRFGLTFGDTNKYLGFNAAFDARIFTKTDDGFEFTYGNEHATDVANKLIDFVNNNTNVLKGQANGQETKFPDQMISSGGGNNASRIFIEGRSLFTCSLVADAPAIIDAIDFEYGLLPYPKWNEEQENYQTALQRSCYALIPVSTSIEDEASAVLEALSSESHRTLMPEYCEITLKTRYSQDSNVSRMFDLISDSIIYDPGEIYSNGSPGGFIRYAINAKLNWTSHIAANREALVTKMQEVVDHWKK